MAEPHKMKVHRLFHPSFLLLIFLCVSCSARVQPVGSPTITAPPVLTNTPKPEGTAINRTATADWVLFQSTLSVLMTQVAVFQSPTPTPTRTRIPATATPYVTPRPTTLGEAKLNPQESYLSGSSPDLQWFWRMESQSEGNYEITHIVNADGSKEFFVHPEEGETELRHARYRPYFWLPDQPYVYMRGNGCCIDSSPTHYLIRKLIRFNLETGEISTILPWINPSYSLGYSVGFSPDGKYLIWSQDWKPVVHIVTLRNGNEILARLDGKYCDIGVMNSGGSPSGGWSPDRNKVILETYLGCANSSDINCAKAAFIVMDAKTGVSTVIQNELTESIDIFQDDPYQIKWLDDAHIQVVVNDVKQTIPINLP